MGCGAESGLLPVGEALACYRHVLMPLSVEAQYTETALGQVLAEAAYAATDLPLFDQSAVDGYAARASDLQSASTDSPVVLRLAGELPAGSAPGALLAAGTTARILTGAPVPPGADTVVRQELARRDGDKIIIDRQVVSGQDLRRRGEEVTTGTSLAEAGLRLDAGRVAALAMAGVQTVRVHRRARVTLLVTGDEVRPLGTHLEPGQIHDANGPLVRGWLAARCQPLVACHQVEDRFEAVSAALARALEESDLVLTTGGVSVGDRDFIPHVAAELGVTRHFWKLAQKPGKPLWFGTRGNQAVLALPGNPAAVLVGLLVHAEAVLRRLEGEPQGLPWRHARLVRDVRPDNVRDQWLRMRQVSDARSGAVLLEPLPRQASHMLSNLMVADALAWVPARAGQSRAGSIVRWLPLR